MCFDDNNLCFVSLRFMYTRTGTSGTPSGFSHHNMNVIPFKLASANVVSSSCVRLTPCAQRTMHWQINHNDCIIKMTLASSPFDLSPIFPSIIRILNSGSFTSSRSISNVKIVTPPASTSALFPVARPLSASGVLGYWNSVPSGGSTRWNPPMIRKCLCFSASASILGNTLVTCLQNIKCHSIYPPKLGAFLISKGENQLFKVFQIPLFVSARP